MEREEIIRLANHVAFETPTFEWLVIYHAATNSYEVIPQSELAPGATEMGAVIVHVSHAAPEYQLA